MNISITGNREGWTYEKVKEVLLKNGISKSDVLITGGAEGVDTFVQRFAKEIGAECDNIYPDPSLPSPDRYYKRNLIVVLRSYILIAFNKNGNPRSGTHNSITQAKEHGKKVIEVTE